MRGLLLKDLYLARKNCWYLLLIAAVYAAAALLGGGINYFWTTYVGMFLGMIPMTLYAIDERDGWTTFCLTQPHTRARVASSKYVLCLLIAASGVTFVTVVEAVSAARAGTFSPATYAFALALAAAVFTVPTALTLPFMYLFGAERGRLAYIIVIGVSVAVVSGSIISGGAEEIAPGNAAAAEGAVPVAVSASIFAVTVVIFALSWLASVAVYKRREF